MVIGSWLRSFERARPPGRDARRAVEGGRGGAHGGARTRVLQPAHAGRIREHGARVAGRGVRCEGSGQLPRRPGMARLRAHWLGADALAVEH